MEDCQWGPGSRWPALCQSRQRSPNSYRPGRDGDAH
jgi:hypothetical protein